MKTNKHGKSVTIIGGGVIGLCCAYYLRREGREVLVIDQGDITQGTSFGNAGYISPSHFIPLASPYIIGKALKWTLNSSSPFYIQPRLDKDLFRWCMAFWRSSNVRYMQRTIPPLNEILHFSRDLMNELRDELGNHFRMEEKGCWMLFKTAGAGKKEVRFAQEAEALGITSRVCTAAEVRKLEPQIEVNVKGGVLYPIDCHLHPGDFMETLFARLVADGVTFKLNTEVSGFRTHGNKVLSVIADKEEIQSDEVIFAAGAWLPRLCGMLDIKLLLQAGKGYSMTYPDAQPNLVHPAILVERRVAMTPMGKDLRIGGTMELSGINNHVMQRRVAAIYQGAKEYFPGLKIPPPVQEQVWTGLRPLSPDGLPYIGRQRDWQNVTIAGGHAMLGLTLAAATGKLVEELLSGKKTTVGLAPFDPGRFNHS